LAAVRRPKYADRAEFAALFDRYVKKPPQNLTKTAEFP
jgi:hypothetical protein